jgi:hypothetical protein
VFIPSSYGGAPSPPGSPGFGSRPCVLGKTPSTLSSASSRRQVSVATLRKRCSATSILPSSRASAAGDQRCRALRAATRPLRGRCRRGSAACHPPPARARSRRGPPAPAPPQRSRSRRQETCARVPGLEPRPCHPRPRGPARGRRGPCSRGHHPRRHPGVLRRDRLGHDPPSLPGRRLDAARLSRGPPEQRPRVAHGRPVERGQPATGRAVVALLKHVHRNFPQDLAAQDA